MPFNKIEKKLQFTLVLFGIIGSGILKKFFKLKGQLNLFLMIIRNPFKGTVDVISSDALLKSDMHDS